MTKKLTLKLTLPALVVLRQTATRFVVETHAHRSTGKDGSIKFIPIRSGSFKDLHAACRCAQRRARRLNSFVTLDLLPEG